MSDSSTLALLHLDGDLTNSGVSPAKFTVENGSPKFVDNSKFGTKCLQFDGRSSIACPYGMGGITLGNQFTIDFWAKYNNWQSYSCLFTIGTTNNTNAICLFSWHWNSTSIEYFFGTFGGAAGTSFRIDMNKNWHHFAITYNNEYYDLFVDGKKKISKFHYKFNPQQSYKIRFGGSIGESNEFWLAGYMDEIRISNCVRYTSDFTPEGGHTPLWL